MDKEEIRLITSRVRQQIKSILPITDKKLPKLGYDITYFKKVVVIVGSSRGGTSVFFDVLRHHTDISSPDGEHGKYYTLHNISYPFYASDRLPSYTQIPNSMLWYMLLDVGRTNPLYSDECHFADNFITRLPMQFYYRNFNYLAIRDEYLANGMADFSRIVDRAGIMKRYYDLKSVGMENAEAFNPLSDFYICETPFIFPHRHKRALEIDDFEESVLLIKTSVDAYRMGWVEELFPDSDVRFIHLTRNPAAAVNGLIDGWRTNRGFFTYMVPDIDIEGYERTDLWNYDLPPNWPELVSKDLTTVTYNQWSQAHRHIMEYEGRPVLRVKFEDFLDKRDEVLHDVLEFMDLPTCDFLDRHAYVTKEVMTTQPPRRFRWMDREEEILPVLHPHKEFIREVGYDIEEADTEWI